MAAAIAGFMLGAILAGKRKREEEDDEDDGTESEVYYSDDESEDESESESESESEDEDVTDYEWVRCNTCDRHFTTYSRKRVCPECR
ncbi:hypothetical protein [Emiliania huxleyi virus 99B1]|nr:hypothetical protein [Emiliania huxleyi virus 99B1]|mmetsp:Transcript_16712/g.48397  ORF Transcript_16712/g.48397 Transcript_16712/m.48397 type:complete len:87 (+) Transcript_16712:388-648(+)